MNTLLAEVTLDALATAIMFSFILVIIMIFSGIQIVLNKLEVILTELRKKKDDEE